MVNVLNKKMHEELCELFEEADECVLVDFNGLSVEEINSLRSSLTHNKIHMQVVKTSIAHLVLNEQEREGYDDMLLGQTAVVWGGEGIIHVSKSINDFAKKSKKLKIKGGFLGPKSIDPDEIKTLTTIPDRPILLGSIVGTFMDPLQGVANGLNQILSSIVNLVDALHEKKDKESQG